MIFIQTVLQWDKWLFVEINSGHSNTFSDVVLPWLRNSFHWIPLYIFIIVFVAANFPQKGWWWLLFLLCTVAITDITGTRLFKDSFERLRPCCDPDFLTQVKLRLTACPEGYSFTSNHAANHFGMAAFMFFTFRDLFNRWVWLAFIWAAAISYSQVYVGVHYPSDILGGALLGIFTGWLTSQFFHKQFGSIQT